MKKKKVEADIEWLEIRWQRAPLWKKKKSCVLNDEEKNLARTDLVQDCSHQSEGCGGNEPLKLGLEPQFMPGACFSFPQNDHCLSHAPLFMEYPLSTSALPYAHPVHSSSLSKTKLVSIHLWESCHGLPSPSCWLGLELRTTTHVPKASSIWCRYEVNHFLHLKITRTESMSSQRLAHAWLLNTSQINGKGINVKILKVNGTCCLVA